MSEDTLTVDKPEKKEETEVGNYFVSNYPPFSLWNTDSVPQVFEAFDRPGDQTRETPLGLYIHIPKGPRKPFS